MRPHTVVVSHTQKTDNIMTTGDAQMPIITSNINGLNYSLKETGRLDGSRNKINLLPKKKSRFNDRYSHTVKGWTKKKSNGTRKQQVTHHNSDV